jgi:hypothetical protein
MRSLSTIIFSNRERIASRDFGPASQTSTIIGIRLVRWHPRICVVAAGGGAKRGNNRTLVRVEVPALVFVRFMSGLLSDSAAGRRGFMGRGRPVAAFASGGDRATAA